MAVKPPRPLPRPLPAPTPEVAAIKGIVAQALRARGQFHDPRRLPCRRAIELYQSASGRLKLYVRAHPADQRAWRMLCAVQEALLEHDQARESLEAAVLCAGKSTWMDQHTRRRLAYQANFWTSLGLSPLELGRLGDGLRAHMREWDRPAPLTTTTRLLCDRGLYSPSLLARLSAAGGDSDRDVLHRVAYPAG